MTGDCMEEKVEWKRRGGRSRLRGGGLCEENVGDTFFTKLRNALLWRNYMICMVAIYSLPIRIAENKTTKKKTNYHLLYCFLRVLPVSIFYFFFLFVPFLYGADFFFFFFFFWTMGGFCRFSDYLQALSFGIISSRIHGILFYGLIDTFTRNIVFESAGEFGVLLMTTSYLRPAAGSVGSRTRARAESE